ncbi:hypothetical protein PR001_g7724 [Phytophthora rubi]|uniref:Uncharacterized protein n=2 Tax=Phytophthora rubi TaxID=129364 RepID=A0A6A3N0G0_9STRA|nr:hypothetical protein PR001_g7724 [Phytophthora rubi]
MESQLSSLLRGTSSDKKTVVYIDGYDNSTSMSDLSNDFRRELTYKIPATVALGEEGQYGMQMEAPAAYSGEEGEGSDVDDMMFELEEMDVYNEMKIDTVSWSFEDYRQAVPDESFFQTVRGVFPPYNKSEDEDEEAAKINELLETKLRSEVIG